MSSSSSYSFSHSSDLSSYVNSNETLTNEDINTFLFPEMLKQISKFQNSFLDDRNSRTIAAAGESNNQHQHLHGQLEKLRGVVKYVEESFNKLTEFEQFLNITVQSAVRSVALTVKEVTETPPPPQDSTTLQINDVVQTKLKKLNDIVMNLRLLLRSAHTISHLSSNLLHHTMLNPPSSSTPSALIDELCNLSSNEFFRRSSVFEDIRQVYSSLDIKLKLCLLCFSVFPEGAVLKRRVLMYWWIGEGLIVQHHEVAWKTVEDVADEILKEFVIKGLINPVGNNRCRPFAKRFVMPYLIRSVVIQLAKEAEFVDFDLEGNPTTNFLSSHKACLTEGSSFSTSENSVKVNKQLQTLFNVSEVFLKLEANNFIGLKYLRVLQLGSWNSSAKRDIKVKRTDFLIRLENMKHLVYFSLQGISGIKELPDTIGRLINLRILNLRDCHNLEVLPEGIASLKYLTHLDLSDCYFLNSMPKGIAALSELQVLKGFVISDPNGFPNSKIPCSLDDLKNLWHLRKLSISTGQVDAFPTDEDLKSLKEMRALRKLKIAWGRAASNQSKAAYTEVNELASRPKLNRSLSMLAQNNRQTLALESLEKLELQSFPHSKRPYWLNPRRLKSLKKLYIRGGGLSDLIHINDDLWKVEILSLKYLGHLKMNWIELQASFPNLMFFEKVQCPKLTLCPCDDRGRWRKQIN